MIVVFRHNGLDVRAIRAAIETLVPLEDNPLIQAEYECITTLERQQKNGAVIGVMTMDDGSLRDVRAPSIAKTVNRSQSSAPPVIRISETLTDLPMEAFRERTFGNGVSTCRIKSAQTWWGNKEPTVWPVVVAVFPESQSQAVLSRYEELRTAVERPVDNG